MSKKHFPLFDRSRCCAKCGSDKVGTFDYCEGFVYDNWDSKCGRIIAVKNGKRAAVQTRSWASTALSTMDPDMEAAIPYIEEHIHRTCPECGYVWIEATLDKGHPLEQLGAQAQ